MGLLERLAQMTHCEYLSDLHYVRPVLLQGLLLDVPADSFPLEEWLDTEAYLIGTKRFGGRCRKKHWAIIEAHCRCEDVRQRIIQKLSRQDKAEKCKN